jgi:hypothetical protein
MREISIDGTTYDLDSPNQPHVNVAALVSKADQAIANLESADANWATLTAAQKDAATRLAVRVTAKLARLALGRLDAN